MKVLVACEFSGVVRESFKNLGHNAWSCDLLESEIEGNHIQGDCLKYLNEGWDLIIAHPPCTYLSVSGSAWFYHPEDKGLPFDKRRPHPKYPNRREDQRKAIDFFMRFVHAPCDKIAIENPISVMSSKYRKPDQIIQPWQFGHGETKATCFWLKGLPLLKPTNIVEGRKQRLHYLPPSKDRQKIRSKTFKGIADAMSSQWGERF
jgi:hypothetical protein